MAPSSALSAIPVVKSLEGCTDFSSTVLPYTNQLQELPWKILEAGGNLEAQKQLNLNTNPLITALAFALAISPIFLVVSEINRNYSQVDRCWSILPTVFIAHYFSWAHLAGIPTTYLDHILAFSVTWSIRLTYNYWRKGGYEIGSEDYRWAIVKSKVHPALFFLFNVVFISLAQSLLLFMITTPLYLFILATQKVGNDITSIDYAFAATLPLLVVFEWVADGQQWNFHQAKAEYQKKAKAPQGWTSEEMDRGFCTRGLWAYSRHPNFAAEQTIWTVLYAWSCYRTGTYYNWTGLGAISYVILFQASTWLTELISAGKYPEYGEYQLRVGKFLPGLDSVLFGPTVRSDRTVTESKKKAIKEANKKKG